jgi:hypothetical protein
MLPVMNISIQEHRSPLCCFPGQPTRHAIRSEYKEVQTAITYTHVLNLGSRGWMQHLDRFQETVRVDKESILRADRSASQAESDPRNAVEVDAVPMPRGQQFRPRRIGTGFILVSLSSSSAS